MTRFGSLFSGIEAASCAWEPLGFEPAWFAEIEPFCCHLLSQRWPGVPNLGDVTDDAFDERAEQLGTIDILVGGSPCQSFSRAGSEAGLDDPRGQLVFAFLRVALRLRPRWFVWENVPGVLSNDKGRTFGRIVREMVQCGYGVAWRVLDAQYFGVPQRRRRVFVVGHLGDWRSAGAVLFEPDCVSRRAKKGGSKKEAIAGTFTASSSTGRHNYSHAEAGLLMVGTLPATDGGASSGENPLVFNWQSGGTHNYLGCDRDVSSALTSHQTKAIAGHERARRLTPRECERLFGFSDDYTAISIKGKPAADSPRYNALGNSMAVPVVRWIGKRIKDADG